MILMTATMQCSAENKAAEEARQEGGKTQGNSTQVADCISQNSKEVRV